MRWVKTIVSSPEPFFPDPQEDFRSKPPFPFDDRSEDDWTDEESCPVCSVKFDGHTTSQLVECALMEIKYPKNWESKRGERH